MVVLCFAAQTQIQGRLGKWHFAHPSTPDLRPSFLLSEGTDEKKKVNFEHRTKTVADDSLRRVPIGGE